MLLIKHGADPNIKTKHDGRTPLHLAAAEGHLAVVAIRYGALIDVKDYFGMTPLYLAVKEGHVDITWFLLRKGANPNVYSEQGCETPLCGAAFHGQTTILSAGRYWRGGKFIHSEDFKMARFLGGF
jgi:ankyrin repeat protein